MSHDYQIGNSKNNNNNNNRNRSSSGAGAKTLLAEVEEHISSINNKRPLMASLTPTQTTTTAKATTITRQQSRLQHHYYHYPTSYGNDSNSNSNPMIESVVVDSAQATNWKKLSTTTETSQKLNQLPFTQDVLYIDHQNNHDDSWCESPISKIISSSSSYNLSNAGSACNSTAELYNKISPVESFDFKPEESDFSVMQELWIRKDWADISIRIAFVAPIVLLGILGNLTIIYSMCKFKNFRSKPTNIFILNMAIADLLTTMVCPIAALVKDIYQFYVLGSFICRFEGFVKITCLLVSSYSLIVLSLDWLLCVIKPCRTRISIKHSWLALTTVWITSVLMASPLFVWRKLRHRQWRDFVETWCCELIQYTKYYWVGITFFLIYLPTFIMIIVFVIILAQMDKFEAKLRRSCDSQSSHSLSINIKYRRRIVKIIFAYLLTSIICWTPLQFTVIYRHFRSEPTFSPWFSELTFFAQLSASLTAVMNPIIFGFLSQPFRRLVTKSFMLKFLDKIVTTNNGSPVIGGGARNGDRNQILVMNQRNHRNNTSKNNNTNGFRNNQSDLRLSDRLDMQRINLKQASSSPTNRIVLPQQKHRNSSSRSNNQQVLAANSMATNAEKTSHNNNANKRVSFHSSVVSASLMGRNQSINDVNNQSSVGRGCENKAYEPDDRTNIDINITTKTREEMGIKTNNYQQRRPISTTTSFIQPDRQLLGLSLVSMDSINIEESIAEIVDKDIGDTVEEREQK